MAWIRVLLCHQHPIVRSSLRDLLERESDIRVVGEAANGREALTLADYFHPEIVLLDVKLTQTTGIAAAREIIAKCKDTGVVFVSVDGDEEYVAEAFKAGARGYVLADSAHTDLVHAIRVVAKQGNFLSPSIMSRLVKGASNPLLLGLHAPGK
jgi:DNA-binding NarL/FixJ family response regulator